MLQYIWSLFGETLLVILGKPYQDNLLGLSYLISIINFGDILFTWNKLPWCLCIASIRAMLISKVKCSIYDYTCE